MEGIYFKHVFDQCFPTYIKFYNCINSKGEELCDLYLRCNNKICLIELKDVLLNAKAKNNSDKQKLFTEFDKKFKLSQDKKTRKKGITQLVNAINNINENGILHDNTLPEDNLDIYPIILYTDNTFSISGLNKKYREEFNLQLKKIQLQSNYVIKDVVFININLFEIFEIYFSDSSLNLFNMLDGYVEHVKEGQFQLTPFEIYSKEYMNRANLSDNKPLNPTFTQFVKTILAAN